MAAIDKREHAWRVLKLAVCAGLLGTPASALDLCVSCQGPDAHYNCRLDTPASNARDLRLQLMCITELAHGGSHASCEVDKAQQNPCPGETKVVAAPASEAPPKAAAAPPATPAPDPDPAPSVTKTEPAPTAVTPPPKAAETATPKPEKPPKTVQEMVEKGAANTGKSLQGAGNAVSNAAKKTWHCIATFFGDC